MTASASLPAADSGSAVGGEPAPQATGPSDAIRAPLTVTRYGRVLINAGIGQNVHQSSTRSAFAERMNGILDRGLPRQSALRLAARITLAHFSVSSATSLPKS